MTKQLKVIIAFALVYVIWGSTYLAIRYAIGTIPPFLMAGTRFFVAGSALYLWQRLRGGPRPTPKQWRNAAIAGGSMLMIGNGLLSWSELRIPSGLAALIVAIVPLWMVVFDWLSGGPRPGRYAIVGIVLGLVGVGLLVGPSGPGGHGGVDPMGAFAVLIASMGWSAGSLFARRADMPKSLVLTTGMEMIAGGVINGLVGVGTGEAAHFQIAAVSHDSLVGLVYLIVLGSWVAYSAYTYLVTAVTPAQLGTYAFVNPCIALLLGWLIAHEPIGPRTVVAMGVIVGAVILLTLKPQTRPLADRSAEAGFAPGSSSASSIASSTK
ncbi:MAG TPA: EamA family transporter [Gemmatimonadaceae bacterium]|jgi:drug/metabolite transporter (DMT)-like permease|nr:EamA family transporter [Gemmatimonadaceae bacterium]